MLEIIAPYAVFTFAWLLTSITQYGYFQAEVEAQRYNYKFDDRSPISPTNSEYLPPDPHPADLKARKFWARMLLATPVWPLVLLVLLARGLFSTSKSKPGIITKLVKDAL